MNRYSIVMYPSGLVKLGNAHYYVDSAPDEETFIEQMKTVWPNCIYEIKTLRNNSAEPT